MPDIRYEPENVPKQSGRRVNGTLIVVGAPGCSVIKEAIMRCCHRPPERRTSSLSQNEKLLWSLRRVHTDLNYLPLSQTVRPARSPPAHSLHSWCHRAPVVFVILKPSWDEEKHTRKQAGNVSARQRLRNQIVMHCFVPLPSPTALFCSDGLISLGSENEWRAKRLREGCLKDDGGNPFTPPPRPAVGAKTQREATSSAEPAVSSTSMHCNPVQDVSPRKPVSTKPGVLDYYCTSVSVRNVAHTVLLAFPFMLLYYSEEDSVHA